MNRVTIYGLSGFVLIADQVTKWLALRWVSPDRSVMLLPGFFDLTLVRNTGGAFGILPHGTWWLALAAVGAIYAIVTFTFRIPQPIPRVLGIALALPLGGALGNLLDRVRLAHVIDFLHVHAGANDWPVFNVADSCICIGVGLLAIYFWSRPAPETPVSQSSAPPAEETL